MWKTKRSCIIVASLIVGFSLLFGRVQLLAEETLTTPMPACGYTPAVTTNSYSGLVEITASGNVFFVPPDGHYDPFYGNNSSGPAPGYPPSPLRIALLSEGGCTCSLECAGRNYFASDFLVGSYPDYNPAHVYTVMLDLPFNERLAFGIPDCGCWDNSGSWTITIRQIERFPNFIISKAQVSFASTSDASNFKGEFTSPVGFTLDPVNQEVFIQVGNFKVNIPAGSFVAGRRGTYTFSGVINGAQISVELIAGKQNSNKFSVDIGNIDLSGTSNPTEFEMRIGDGYGSTSIKLLGTLTGASAP